MIEKLFEAGRRRERKDSTSSVDERLGGKKGERDRRDSVSSAGSVDEMQKRKRGELERSGGIEEEMFKRSRITERSLDRKKEIEGESLGKWMREMGGKFDRLEIWMKDLKEGFRKQENNLMERIEEIRREFKSQREKWEKKRKS